MLSSALLTLAVANAVNAKYSFDPLNHLAGVSLLNQQFTILLY